ncbi:MAG: flavin reductase family protein [Clostridia bacterium]|nr:flavin reductase family protein [Clostridia bacterium]
MKKINLKPGTLLSPLPAVMVSCGTSEKSNIITIAWTGIISTVPPRTYISVLPERFSYEIIKETGEFTINLPGSRLAKRTDLCGMKSGRKEDKFKTCGFTKLAGEKVSCPSIAECPVNIECKVEQILPMGSHDMFIAKIVSVSADAEIIDSDGKLRMDKADVLAYAHGEYFALGKKAGKFGFSVRKKSQKRKQNKNEK